MFTMLEMFNFKIQKPLLMKIVERVKVNWDIQLQQGLVLPDDLADVLMFEIFVALFQIADSDSSGFVSLDELKDIMIMIGIYLPPNELKRVMAEFDVDDSGQIDIDEFSNAMVKEFCQTASPKGFLVDKNTGRHAHYLHPNIS
jgi:Ca2+-binding EF-hand superfamily protein